MLEHRYTGAPVRGTRDGSDPQVHSAVFVGKVFGIVNNQSTAVAFAALREWFIHIVSRRGARNQVIGHPNVNRIFGAATRHVAGYAVRLAGVGMVGAGYRRVAG